MHLSMAFVLVLCHHWIGSFFGLVILLKMACLIIDSILYSVENKSCLSSLLPLLLPRLRCSSSVAWVIHLLSDYYCWSLLITIFPYDCQSHLEYKILLFFFLNTFTAHKSKHLQMAFLDSKYTPGPILKALISLRYFGLQLQSHTNNSHFQTRTRSFWLTAFLLCPEATVSLPQFQCCLPFIDAVF